MEKQFITDLTPGMAVDSIFRVRNASTETTRDSRASLYARCTLRDMSGDAEAKWFDITPEQGAILTTNTYVQVKGKAEQRSGRTQIKIYQVQPYAITPEDEDFFIPKSFRPLDAMEEQLDKFIESVEQPWLRKLLVAIFQEDQALRKDYCEFPASISNHHGTKHGLLQHSLEVTSILFHDAKMVPSWGGYRPNRDLMVCGGLLHDIGKVREYCRSKGDFTWDEMGNFIGHIVLGYELVADKIKQIEGFPKELATMILHFILSHHGKKEFGSPIVPYTYEAELIHLADTKSAAAQHWSDAANLPPTEEGEQFQLANKLFGEYRMFPRRVYVGMGQYDQFWNKENENK